MNALLFKQFQSRLRSSLRRLQIKSYSPPEGGRIALSANERIAEFLDFAIQAKFAYVNKLGRTMRACVFCFYSLLF